MQSIIVNWESLYYEKWVNNSHNYQLVLFADDPNVQFFTTDAIVEVWRQVKGSDWYRELVCFHRTEQYTLEENGKELFTSYGRGLNDLLSRRAILYYANTAFTLKQGPGETVMKELVTENAGPDADDAARRNTGTYSAITYGLSVAADNALGVEWKGAMAWRNLHDQLLEIALATSVDFEISRIGPLSFVFNTYYPQRGIDRTAGVNLLTFAPEFGNMTNITYARSRVEEANVVAVLGQGEEAARQVLVRVSAARSDSLWNTIEMTRDARNQPDVTSMQSTGDAALQETKAMETFTFSTLQTAVRQYGRDYNVGDVVAAKYRAIQVTKKIITAKVNVAKGREEVGLDFANTVD